VREPTVFLFDEPLSNLDAALRINTRIEIAKLHRSLKATTIYVTHDQIEAMTLATKIVVINRGRIEQIGPPLELYHRPASLFVAGFIGSPRMNFITGKVAADIGGKVTLPVVADGAKVGDPVTLGVRPENLAEGPADGLQLTGMVEAVEHLGESSLTHMRLSDDTVIILRTPGDTPTEPGTELTATAPTDLSHLFHETGKAFARTV
jgi:ABC-type sugar transport system ATPase subunit